MSSERHYLKYFILIFLSIIHLPVIAKVTLAVSNAQSGPAANLGIDLNKGAQLYFNSINDIDIELAVKDDGYEPDKTVFNTRMFYSDGQQLFFNYVGTPTTKSVFNFLNAKHLPLITPFTGADFLRAHSAQNVFNLRASYEQEAMSQVKYLVEQLKLKNIAIIIQADDFGLAFEKYFIRALTKKKLRPTFVSRFKRNTLQIEKAVGHLRASNAQAVLFVGTYEPMAALIKQTTVNKPEMIFASVSFVSSLALQKRISSNTKLLVSEVVPNPNTCQFEECKKLRKLNKHQPLSHGVLEGYLNAKWLLPALTACEKQSSIKSCVANYLTKNRIHLLGKERHFEQSNRQVLNQIYFTVMNLPKPINY